MLDHPAHHHYLLLLRQREQLRLWLRLWEQLRLRQRLRLLLIHKGVRRGEAPLFAAVDGDRLFSGHSRFGGVQKDQREFGHSAEAAGFFDEAVEPLQSGFLPSLGGPLHISGEHIQTASQPYSQRDPGIRAVLGHPKLLLGGAQTDKDHLRARGFDLLHHWSGVLKVAVMDPCDDQSGMSGRKILGGLFGNAGLGAQKEKTDRKSVV